MPTLLRTALRLTSTNLLSFILFVSLICLPLFSQHSANAAARQAGSIEITANAKTSYLVAVETMLLRLRTWFQGSNNLDTLRNNLPSPPNSYVSSGTIAPAGYEDPKPTITANYANYLTQMVQSHNPSGPAGALPLQAADPTASSSTIEGLSTFLDSKQFSFAAPGLSLSGRAGLNVSFGLSYSSKVWVKDSVSNTMVFNVDRGFPAPGWRTGFGAIQIKDPSDATYYNSVTGKQSIIYLSPNGTRHDLALATSGLYVSYDSSYLQFNVTTQELSMPNGTKMQFGAYSYSTSNRDYQALPVKVTDRNGNFVSITYKTLDNGKVVIDYFIDTVGRRVDFEYQNNRLIAIKQNRNGSWFYYVRLDYQPVTIQTNFTAGLALDPSTINNTQVWLPSRLTYPTGISLRFSYNSYAQMTGITKWVPTISNQGAERAIASASFSALTPETWGDCPNFSGRTDWAENWGTQNYAFIATFPEVVDPSGRVFRSYINGLEHRLETYPSSQWPGPGNGEKIDSTVYEQDAGLSYRSNPRAVERRTALSNTLSRKIRYSYTQMDGMWLVTTKDEYQDETTVYRRTTTQYTSYPTRYILGLPTQVSVYAGAGVTLRSRTSNTYDESSSFQDSNNQTAAYFIDATAEGAIQHDDANYGGSLTQRGNLTSVTQSGVNSLTGAVTGSRITQRTSYDTNGNVRAETDGAGNRQQYSYSDYYTNKPSGVGTTQAYRYTSANPYGFKSGSQYDYFNGNIVKTFSLRPGSSTEEQVAPSTYDFADRLLQKTQPDGGWMQMRYWDNWLAKVKAQKIDTVGGADRSHFTFVLFDGAQHEWRKAYDHPDTVSGKYSGQKFTFDSLGHQSEVSNVIAINSDWSPGWEDAAGWQMTSNSHDQFDRVTQMTRPDGNTVQNNYTGCRCAGNEVKTRTDEVGCKTRTETDTFGRVTSVSELDSAPGNPIFTQVFYYYDELDRLQRLEHWKGGASQYQVRAFGYDDYGRLVSELQPETGTTTYAYTPNDLVATVTNGRGVTTTYSYNTRNLTTQISYSDGTTPTASFSYDDFGSRVSMSDGEGQTTFAYNNFRQLQNESRTFTGLPGKTYTLSYSYNLANQAKQVIYSGSSSSGAAAPNENLNSFGESRIANRQEVAPLAERRSSVKDSADPTSVVRTSTMNRTLAASALNTLALLRPADFDGDGKTDMAVWRGQEGKWLILRSSNNTVQEVIWGSSNAPYNDLIVPADYDGDNKTDVAVWRPSDGNWYIKRSSDNQSQTVAWGSGVAPYYDVPVPADYDGDGKADLAVWRPGEGKWYIKRSSDNQSQIVTYGAGSAPYHDMPIPADYDGDGKADIAVFRRADATFYILKSSTNTSTVQQWGLVTDIPVPGDYDGDGKADVAVWRGSNGNWYILKSSNSQSQVTNWGASSTGDLPAPGDYDGDSKTDPAFWRPSEGKWYILRSSTGTSLVQQHGQMGDTPVTALGVPLAVSGTLSISGQVSNAEGAGVTLYLSGSQSAQTTTDSNGQYSFTNLPSGGNFTVTPAQNGYSFGPANRTYQNVTTSITGANFTSTPVSVPIPLNFTRTINYVRGNTGSILSLGTDLIGTNSGATTNVTNTMTYNARGGYRGVYYGNGLRLNQTETAQRQQLASFVLEQQNGATQLWQQYYDYYASGPNNGKIRRISDQPDFSNHKRYDYDSYGRLTAVINPPNQIPLNSYTYDEWGNILSMTGAVSQGFTYQIGGYGNAPNNRLNTGGGSFTFQYDGAGNMTQDSYGYPYSYDGANRLKEYLTGGFNVYGYDGDGKRVKSTIFVEPTYSVWSSVLGEVAFEVSASGTVRRAYVYMGKEVAAMHSTDGQFYWLHTDHLGSGRMMTNTSGTMVYNATFDPFGGVVSEWSNGGNLWLNTKKFTGYERDSSSGLDYAKARTYASGLGRFLQSDPLGSGYQGEKPDPMGASKRDFPQSLNRYSYVKDDPINATDPSGLLIRYPDDGCICCSNDNNSGGPAPAAQCPKMFSNEDIIFELSGLNKDGRYILGVYTPCPKKDSCAEVAKPVTYAGGYDDLPKYVSQYYNWEQTGEVYRGRCVRRCSPVGLPSRTKKHCDP
jgi:RHS repeat-associated protein